MSAVTVLTLMSTSIFSSFASDVNSEFVPDNSVFSASSVWDKDPNGDGVLDVYDSIQIQQYLHGLIDADNLNEYDINNNGLVTLFDAWVVNAHLLGILKNSTNDKDYLNNNLLYSKKTYLKHDCSSNDNRSSTMYTLARPLNQVLNSNLSVNYKNIFLPERNKDSVYIVTKDDVSMSPDQAVVRLGEYGTGFIIDDHIIVTAAHCVFQRNDKGDREFINFVINVYDESGTKIVEQLQPKFIHVPIEYIGANTSYTEYDFALVYVENAISQAYGRYHLGIATDDYITSKGSVMVGGFPNIQDIGRGYRVNTRGYLNPDESNDSTIRYNVPTAGGSSGGPVFFNETYVYQDATGFHKVYCNSAIGIHSASDGMGSATGARMDKDKLYFYYSNPYLK